MRFSQIVFYLFIRIKIHKMSNSKCGAHFLYWKKMDKLMQVLNFLQIQILMSNRKNQLTMKKINMDQFQFRTLNPFGLL